MIKTSGYRVSPTEIEEVAYATGLVRDAVALGVDDDPAGPADRARRGTGRDGELDADALLAAMRRELPLYMVPGEIVRPRRDLRGRPNGKFDRTLLRQELAG